MRRIREPAVAGTFYPADPAVLRTTVEGLVASAPADGPPPKAVIVPHAGYVYSGAVAATAYRRLAPLRGVVRRVILVGPAHRYAMEGIVTHAADAFRTPLGLVPVDAVARRIPGVAALDAAHEHEHGLEVHLPFLQTVLGEFCVVPLLVGLASDEQVADVLDSLWGGPETLVVVSSDLSHYLPYDEACDRDGRTAAAISQRRADDVGPQDACGRRAVRGLLRVAERRGLPVVLLDLRNSGDTAGPRDHVVGYGAFAVG